MHGRFTSPDEFKGGPDELFDFEEDASDNPTFYADLNNPQSLNKYQYTYNNPHKYADPTGHCPLCGILFSRTIAPRIPLPRPYPGQPIPGQTITQVGTRIGRTLGEISRPVSETVDMLAPIRPQPIFGRPAAEAVGQAQPQALPKPNQMATHRKNRNPSNLPRHQKGDTRKKTDQGGEKGDKNRKNMPNHTPKKFQPKGPGREKKVPGTPHVDKYLDKKPKIDEKIP